MNGRLDVCLQHILPRHVTAIRKTCIITLLKVACFKLHMLLLHQLFLWSQKFQCRPPFFTGITFYFADLPKVARCKPLLGVRHPEQACI